MDVSQEPSSSQGRKEKEIDVGLVAKDGAIGCYKNGSFQAMTNFSIACKGFVSCGSAVEGYLIHLFLFFGKVVTLAEMIFPLTFSL